MLYFRFNEDKYIAPKRVVTDEDGKPASMHEETIEISPGEIELFFFKNCVTN